VLSYTGQLNLTAVGDRDSCPDLDVFAQAVRTTLDDLARSALEPCILSGTRDASPSSAGTETADRTA
jgi:hypothetical protein